jgi:hypothetical protein
MTNLLLAPALALTVLAMSSPCVDPVGFRHDPPARGAELFVWTTDGAFERGELVGWDVERDAPRIHFAGRPEPELVLPDRFLSAHGAVPAEPGPGRAEVFLVGGSRLVGELLAGDENGETFVVQSASLGRLAVFVDRLRTIRFVDRAGDAELSEFDVPPGEREEALFRPLRRGEGFSSIVGSIYRFGANGIEFARGDDEEPSTFAYGDLAAISLRDGFPPDDPGPWRMLTRAGDLVRLHVDGFADGRIEGRAAGGQAVSIAVNDVSCLTRIGEERVLLSSLDPVEADEHGYFERTTPLMPFRRGRSVDGGYLATGSRPWIEGVGVHAFSRLVFEVPAGATRFLARVGVDDGVVDLPVRADVVVSVLVDGEALVDEVALRSGDPGLAIGPFDVAPGSRLELRVDFGRGFDLGDRVDWLGGVFLR